PGVDDESNRPLPLLTGLQGVLLEAETLELVEMRRGLVRGIARYRLRRHAPVLRVLEFVYHGGELARVHLHRTARGLEVPRAAHIGIELNGNDAAGIDLGVAQLHVGTAATAAGYLPLGQGQNVDTGRFADVLVDRDQRIAETEHAGSDHGQFADHPEVLRGDGTHDEAINGQATPS